MKLGLEPKIGAIGAVLARMRVSPLSGLLTIAVQIAAVRVG
jgi:hypothetical protein